MVVSASISVGSMRCAISVVTGRLEKIETPRSPRTRSPSQAMNWMKIGWSRPSWVRIFAICSAVA